MLYESKRKGNIIGRGKEREKEKLPVLAISTAREEYFIFILPVIS